MSAHESADGGILPEETWNAMTQQERWNHLRSEGQRVSAKVDALKARVAAGEQPFTNARRAASVALLRAMDREPRSYLIEVLRAVHAGAGREELGDLLREAFGPSTSAMVTPGKWTMLRDKFATYLTAGSAAVLSMSNEERALALAYKDRVPSHQEQRAGVVFAALFAHILAFASGEL